VVGRLHFRLGREALVGVAGDRAEPAVGHDGDVPDREADGGPAGDGLGGVLLGSELPAGVEHLVVGPPVEGEERSDVVFHGWSILGRDSDILTAGASAVYGLPCSRAGLSVHACRRATSIRCGARKFGGKITQPHSRAASSETYFATANFVGRTSTLR